MKKKRKTIALFGGSFDPFHKGHYALLEAAIENFTFDRVIVMPVGIAPHKRRRLSFSSYRLEMTRLACEGLENTIVSDREIKTPDRSYTVETLKDLQADYPESNFILISGSDLLFTIEDWYKHEEIIDRVKFAIALRGYADEEMCEKQTQYLRRHYNANIELFSMPAIPISATAIRAHIDEGVNVDDDLPDAVSKFIKLYRPYAFADVWYSIKHETWAELINAERKLFFLLTRKRRLHAVSSCLMAMKIAKAQAVNVRDAGLAALLHDMAKELPETKQREYANAYLKEDKNLPDDLLHGPAAAYMAKEDFAIESEDILNAICYHTTARPNMSPLEKIVFIADKIEFSRPYRRLDEIRNIAFTSSSENENKYKYLDKALCICFEEIFHALQQSDTKVSSLSKKAYELLNC